MEFDPYETCPYDVVHRIRRSRMQFHITICSKNFPASKMMQCPFDARHKVNKVEFEYHKNHCPARESVIHYAICDASQAEQKTLPIDVNPVGVSDENWDEGANVKTYNPLQAIQDKPIVYPIIGLSKAKRKNHRMQERMRFNQIMENSGNQSTNQREIQTNSSIKGPQLLPKKSVDKKDEEDYKPLRRPLHIGNKSNSAPRDKSQNFIPFEDLKKLPQRVNNTSNVPISYATALSKNKTSPIFNKSKENNDSIIDKLSRTFEEIGVDDEGHKKKTEQLDKQLNMLKKIPSENKKQENKKP